MRVVSALNRHKTRELGAETIEKVLLLFVSVVILIGILAYFEQDLRKWVTEGFRAVLGASSATEEKPPKTPSALVIALFASLIASIGWNVRQMALSMSNRAQLLLLEILSAGKPMSRRELRKAVKAKDWLLRVFTEPIDSALLDLVKNRQVDIRDGIYELQMVPADSAKSSG